MRQSTVRRTWATEDSSTGPLNIALPSRQDRSAGQIISNRRGRSFPPLSLYYITTCIRSHMDFIQYLLLPNVRGGIATMTRVFIVLEQALR